MVFCFSSSVLPFPVVALRIRQPLPDDVEFPLRRGDAALRFLLECVQDVDRIRPSAVWRLGRVPFLGGVEGLTDLKLDRARKRSDVPA